MNAILKSFLSMSCSGGVLILALLLGKRFWKDKISRQWQYYIWLIVILRLLIPFGPEMSLLGKIYQTTGQAITQAAPFPELQLPLTISGEPSVPDGTPRQEYADHPWKDVMLTQPLQDMAELLGNHIWLLWLAAVLGLLIRKVTLYQGFVQYIKAGLTPISDIEMLDRLSAVAERSGIKKPVELCVNPLISTPLLIGIFHPCIVLPSADIPEKDFLYIILHELTHYKQRDILYKWLVQVTVCLHWFNPLVHLMGREITKACEFSCDEAVLTKMGNTSAQDYGKTLLDAMAAVGKYKENLGAVTLSENKQLLKERLVAIMNFKRKPTSIRFLTGVLTLCMILGASFIGVYPVAAASGQMPDISQASYQNKNKKDEPPVQEGSDAHSDRYSRMAEKSYEAGSVPLFQIAFSRLDEEAQCKWLDRIYMDNQIAFWGAVTSLLEEDCAQILHLAETVYEDGNIVFFSILANHMTEDTLEKWLDRALEDEEWTFQSILFKALDWDWDEQKEQQEKEWEKAQMEEYGAVGVAVDGKDYYYQGQLVNIFLDIRSNKSFYTLNMNPKGTVNIKIVRNEKNEITGVAYMTEAEVTELFGDMEDTDNEDDDTDVKIIPVDFKTIAAGETVFLGEYTFSDGDKIWYDVSAKTGNRMKVFFAKDEQKDVLYWSVNNLRQPGESLECIADFTVGPPSTKPGTYKLYLQAPDSALGNVKGHVSIAQAKLS